MDTCSVVGQMVLSRCFYCCLFGVWLIAFDGVFSVFCFCFSSQRFLCIEHVFSWVWLDLTTFGG